MTLRSRIGLISLAALAGCAGIERQQNTVPMQPVSNPEIFRPLSVPDGITITPTDIVAGFSFISAEEAITKGGGVPIHLRVYPTGTPDVLKPEFTPHPVQAFENYGDGTILLTGANPFSEGPGTYTVEARRVVDGALHSTQSTYTLNDFEFPTETSP